jgi:DNA-binding transcriptional regulator YhcF (GntR family)
MSIGENNRLPLYAQVENVIISRIAAAHCLPVSRLPSEDSMASQLRFRQQPRIS